MSPLIVYEGAKTFAKCNSKYEVLIANHHQQHCLEVIIFTTLQNSTTRLYLNSDLLVSKIDMHMFNNTFQIKRKSAERMNQPVDTAQLMTQTATSMVVAMILSRLQMTDVTGDGFGTIYLKPSTKDCTVARNSCDDSTSTIDFEYLDMPEELIPYDASLRIAER